MLLFRMYNWAIPFFEGENGGGAGGDSGAAGAAGGARAADGGGGEGTGGAAGGQTPSLRAQLAPLLPESERPNFNSWAEGYASDAEFVKAAHNMRQTYDSRVPVPKQGAKPEELDQFFQKVGKPAAPKDYAYDWGKDEKGQPKALPDADAQRFERFKEYAHQNHYTQQQFEAGIKFLEEDTEQQNTLFIGQLNRAQDGTVAAMKQDWGPDYDSNIQAAIQAGVQYAPSETEWVDFVNLPLAGGIKVGDHPTFLKTFANVGRASGEDQRIRNMEASGEFANLDAEIGRLEAESMDKGWSTANGPHAKKLEELYKKRFPRKHSATGGQGFGA